MVATVQVSVSTGATPTRTDGVAGIDFISADNATNDITNRQQYPISVGTRSYEKWVQLKVATPPANYVTTFLIWGDGAVATSSTLYFTCGVSAYIQSTNANSTVATFNFTSYTVSNKATWDTTTYWSTNTGSYTKYAVFQLAIGSDSNPGNWTQETISYSYLEA